mgnify:CR=1 FL=1
MTRDELTRTGAVAARAAAADAKIVKAEGVVPAGETCRGRNQSEKNKSRVCVQGGQDAVCGGAEGKSAATSAPA